MNDEQILRTIIHALRHDPWKYGLELDAEGFVRFEDLVTGLRFDRYEWALLEPTEVERVIGTFGEGRFDHREHCIRATYGHSIELGKLPPVEAPPEILFHGTSGDAMPHILGEGLKPMGRRFVHLTSDRDYALRLASIRVKGTIVAVFAAEAAQVSALTFFRANEHVWLTDCLVPNFLAPMGVAIALEYSECLDAGRRSCVTPQQGINTKSSDLR